jgi:hypothetical protein
MAVVRGRAAFAVLVAAFLSSHGVVAIKVASSSSGAVHRGEEVSAKNPVRKVVNLLEAMAKKVAAEGETEKELYEKFKCYCKTGGADLQESINGNDAKVPALQTDIEAASSNVDKLMEDLKTHQADRASAKKAMEQATGIREGEATKFASESTELKGYVDALSKAVPAIMGGMAGTALTQTMSTAAAVMRRAAASDSQLTEDDRMNVLSFFSVGAADGSGYIPAGGEILGILKTMQEDFEKDLAGITGAENEAVQLYNDLIAAKQKEVHTLGSAIEQKTARVGELNVEVVHMKQDLTEAEALLIEDTKFLNELDANCASKDSEFNERVKVRNEELEAIHETIKILNDDDALDLFKKTLPSAGAFVQVAAAQAQATRAREGALAAVRKLGGAPGSSVADRPEVRFLSMALQGKKVDFSKVIKMIDDMMVLLKQEQVDDDNKREYCRLQLDNTEDKAKELKHSIDEMDTNIEDKTETIAQLMDEIKTLNADVAELDRLVMDAGMNRKNENSEFTDLMSANTEAKEILEYAKNRLMKFYNPALYKKPPAPEEDVQMNPNAQFMEIVKEKPPQTWSGDVNKKSEESGGVVQMIDLLVRDLTKEMAVAETDEEHAQKEYEAFMDDSASKRAKSLKAVEIKEAAKADEEMVKTALEGDHSAETEMLQATNIYQHQLHSECDWMMQNYDLRRTARADEADSLKSAKATLSGADFSLAQKSQHRQ